jgi:hypothetical protein
MITCPGCACESLSYSEDLPCRALKHGKDMEHSALAVHMTRDKWDAIFRKEGKTLTHITIAFPCEMFDTDRELILEKLGENDAAAVLACSSGFIGIKDLLSTYKGRVVPMMKTAGTFVFRLISDEQGEYSKVDKETARIVKFSESTAY